MRILFLSSVYPRSYTRTLGVYCESLCTALAANHEVRVVSPVGWVERFRCGKPDPLRTSGKSLNSHVVDYPCYIYTPKVLRTLYGWFMWQSVRRSVRRLTDSFSPECVLSYWLHPDGEAAIRIARSLRIPCAVIVGGSDARLLPRDAKRRRCIARVLDDADALITVSRGLKDSLIELGASAEKVWAISQGLDRGRFAPGNRMEERRRLNIPADKKMLLWVGSMVPVKGLEVLLQGCQILAARLPNFHLCLVGDGPLRQQLTEQVKARGLSSLVTFVGAVTHENLPSWYRAADLTVLSSWSEGIPNVLRESLACGTPFVSTRVGDVEELCEIAENTLVPAGDAAALADAMAQALAKPDGQQLRSIPDSWDKYAEKVADVLFNVIDRRDLTQSSKGPTSERTCTLR